MAWHWVDYAIAAIIGLSVITGLFRGFVKELIALCVWILAIWVAMTYSTVVNGWLQPHLHDKTERSIVSFVGILLTIIIAGAVVNKILSFILRRSGLSGTDRILGMGFGFIRGIFFVALLMLAVDMTSIPHEEMTRQSYLYKKFDPLVNWLRTLAPDVINQVKAFDKDNSHELDKKDIISPH